MAKHSLTIAGHRTSISLEPEFWDALKAIAAERGTAVAALVGELDGARGKRALSAAIRVFVLDHHRRGAAPHCGTASPSSPSSDID